MKKDRFYITTPIFYPNGVPHIGHAYTALACDTMARFNRLDGKDVFFLTGTDEHGQKMQQTARETGTTPLELATKNAQIFGNLWKVLNISHDEFIRTTQPRHHKASRAVWKLMAEKGDIYLGSYSGWYSVRQEAFFEEKETTLGPDGIRREPLGSPVEWVQEESYFFRLSAYGDRLLEFFDRNPGFIGPKSRENEVRSFIRSGLRDISISRTSFDWGVKVPGDEKHVMYVWVDALTNYITAAGFPDTDDEKWQFWPADVHVIGKDIIRFHAVYWPAFLMSAGIELPKRIFAHGFLLSEGEKMSKSVGNVVDPFALVERFGADAVRFFCLREVPFGQDGSYSEKAIIGRINSDLANDLGNLAQRSLSMITRHCGGMVPEPARLLPDDQEILATVDGLLETVREHVAGQALHKYLGEIWQVVGEANRYFAAREPWALRRTDPERMGCVLYVTAEILRQVAILTQPVMPASCAELLDLLGVAKDRRDFSHLGPGGRLACGIHLPEPRPLFPRQQELTEEKS